MKATLIFPTILIALDIGASVVYAACGHYKKPVYWRPAATLTACVTYSQERNELRTEERAAYAAQD